MNTHAHQRRSAFTLVELLVVIAIITILASLIAAGAFWAIQPARDAAIQLTIKDVESAIESYALEDGRGYPPTETLSAGGKTAFINHLRSINRYNQESLAPTNIPDLDPSETLVYFLGGNSLFPGSNGANFSIKKNSTNPITGAGEIDVRFDFDVTRLVDPDGDGFYSYQPNYIDDSVFAPLVYFAAADYGNAQTLFNGGLGVARPYFSSVTGAPMKANRFQIISAGQDGNFGGDVTSYPTDNKQYPGGLNYDIDYEGDNITNFSEGRFSNKLP